MGRRLAWTVALIGVVVFAVVGLGLATTLGIGFMLMAFDPKGRALHDCLAGRIVLRR